MGETCKVVAVANLHIIEETTVVLHSIFLRFNTGAELYSICDYLLQFDTH